MDLALVTPDIGTLIESLSYADELVVAFNLSCNLRKNFLGEICSIKHLFGIWRLLQVQAAEERASELVERQFWREAWGNFNPDEESSDDDRSSSSWG
jgi:hypothetical protein